MSRSQALFGLLFAAGGCTRSVSDDSAKQASDTTPASTPAVVAEDPSQPIDCEGLELTILRGAEQPVTFHLAGGRMSSVEIQYYVD